MKHSNTHKGAFFKLISLIIGILLLVAMVSWVLAWAFDSVNDILGPASRLPSTHLDLGVADRQSSTR